MRTRQIFRNYEYQSNEGIDGIRYCPACGYKFIIGDNGGKNRPVCSNCGYVFYKNPSPAVSVLIVNENRVLLGKRAKGSFLEGKWCLPCGYMEFEEDFLTAAKRETKEETGLDIEIDSIVSVMSNFLSRNVHSLVVVLLAHVKCGSPEPGDDISELMWHEMDKEFPDMAFEADRHIIERFFRDKISGLTVDLGFR